MPNWCGIWSQCGNISSMVFISLNMPAMLAGNTYQQSLSGGQESRNLSTFDAGATTEKHMTNSSDSLCRTACVGQDWSGLYIYSQVLTTGSLIASALYIVIPGSSLTRITISLLFTFMLRHGDCEMAGTVFMTHICTCTSHPSPFGREAVSLCIAHLPGMSNCRASGHIDAPQVSHTAAATWRSRRSEFSKTDKKKRMHAKHLCIRYVWVFVLTYWLFSPLDSVHLAKVELFLDRTRISQGILLKAGTGHSVKLVSWVTKKMLLVSGNLSWRLNLNRHTPGWRLGKFRRWVADSRLYLRIPAASVQQKGRSLKGWGYSSGILPSQRKSTYQII